LFVAGWIRRSGDGDLTVRFTPDPFSSNTPPVRKESYGTLVSKAIGCFLYSAAHILFLISDRLCYLIWLNLPHCLKPVTMRCSQSNLSALRLAPWHVASEGLFGFLLLKFNSYHINVPSNAWSTKCELIACMSVQIRSNL
jgi:hypothetical protein